MGTTLAFRLDASRAIGLGHLSRCLNVADAAVALGAPPAHFCLRAPQSYQKLISERGHIVHEVAHEGGDDAAPLGSADSDALLAVARSVKAGWIIVDHYGAHDRYLRALVSAEARLAVIDDLADRDLSSCDLVINPTPGSAGWDYKLGPKSTLLAGAEFAMLNRSFAEARARSLERDRNPIGRILVVMGGTDGSRTLHSVLLAVLATFEGRDIEVVAVGAAGGTDSTLLQPLAAALAAQRLHFVGFQAPSSLVKQMVDSDLVIATPSTLAWELSCLGVPAIFLRTAVNQDRIVGALRPLGMICVQTLEQLAPALSAEREAARATRIQRASQWAAICDGEGASRVAERLLSAAPSRVA